MNMKWRTDEPPKDCVILADVGYPFAVVAAWNGIGGGGYWVHADFQIGMYKGEWVDAYFGTESLGVEVKAWMPLPEIGVNKMENESC